MKEFVNIIKQFNVRQRMSVLILLLFFTTTTFIITTFYKNGTSQGVAFTGLTSNLSFVFSAIYRPSLGPRPTPTGQARKMVQNGPR